MPHPNSLKNIKERRPNIRVNRVTAAMQHRILLALLDGATRNQIVEETGCSISGLKAYLHALWMPAEGENLIYISGWELDKAGRCTIQVFKWGPGMKDVKQPLKKPSQVGADYRQRVLLKRALYGINP